MRLSLAAGEISGDQLGAGLLQALLNLEPNLLPAGIGGPALARSGCRIWQPMDILSVMGLWEVLGRLPQLLRFRRQFLQQLQQWQPDLYLGIDAPDFNFPVEAQMKRHGVPVVHYVSPSVWAWRENRVKTIRDSCDHVLCLFPFEADYYARHDIPASFVGHPFARQIPLQPNRQAARDRLALDDDHRWVALLPGSRMSELQRLAPIFLQAAQSMLRQEPELAFVLPAAGPRQQAWLQQQINQAGLQEHILCLNGHARCVMQACETGLIASGTAALEALLCKLPMVVAYQVHPMTATLIRRLKLMKTKQFSLPNILHGGELVSEYIQEQATPENLAAESLRLLRDPRQQQAQIRRFAELHQQLRRDSDRLAAEVILRVARR